MILAEAHVVVGQEGFRIFDREAFFNLLLTLRNAIVSDGVVIVGGEIHGKSDDVIDLASAAGFTRITTTSMRLELRR